MKSTSEKMRETIGLKRKISRKHPSRKYTHAGKTNEADSKAELHDNRSPCIRFRQRVMPSCETEVRISQG
ncbi:hypothetical protein CR164_08315 [Prosthecochloris marina]|uniref:Uncharacterized protein n=1 Tax=Prosthecochloris marina TaxID=2017681 RepID=A0A317T5J5_9CHLB|nr:hypothetical protein CR164_08315 [Prosthecochloris marina]